MADIKKVVLHDPNSDLSFNINAQGQIEVSIEGMAQVLDDLGGYKISDVDADASPNYYGFLNSDGAWYIIKETLSAGADTYRYIAGASSYNWAGRTGFSYVTFDSAF